MTVPNAADWQPAPNRDEGLGVLNMRERIHEMDLVFITLDTLRYDAAQSAWEAGQLANLGPLLPSTGWEQRHSPASFTYAAHHAFFSGFLPTPATPGPHPRRFASNFSGSETTVDSTFVFEQPTLPEALSAMGFQTICIGGTGFFNPQSRLGQVLPSLFDQSYWTPEMGVANRQSEIHQIKQACACLENAGGSQVFLFINISAIHQPNWFYLGADESQDPIDSLESHTAALVAVDEAIQPLLNCCRNRRETFFIVCSDHGTAYGEDGHIGHRLAHEVVWNVPYAEFLI